MKELLVAIRTLVYPLSCIMCNKPNYEICDSCKLMWLHTAKIFRISNCITSAGMPYDERVAKIVLSAKEDNAKAAKNCILLGLDAALIKLGQLQELPINTFLVSIPSSKAANRSRGGDYLFTLSKDFLANRNLAIKKTLTLPKLPFLMQNSKVKDQSGLSAKERERNMDSAIYVNPRIIDMNIGSRISVLLMDDVITSGATLKSAISALEASKITVMGAIAACASQHQMRIP